MSCLHTVEDPHSESKNYLKIPHLSNSQNSLGSSAQDNFKHVNETISYVVAEQSPSRIRPPEESHLELLPAPQMSSITKQKKSRFHNAI